MDASTEMSAQLVTGRGRMARLIAMPTVVVLIVAAAVLVSAPPAHAHAPHDEISQVVASPAYATDGTVFVISRDVLMRSTDGGSSFNEIVRGIDRHLARRLAIASSNKAIMYMVVDGGVFRSTNQGTSWARTAFGGRTDIAALAVSPTSSDLVFASRTSSGLYRTTDGGQTWGTVGSFGNVTALLASDPSGRVLVGDSTGAIFFSDNGGTTWSRASGTPSADPITAMTSPAALASTVFAGTKSGALFRSVDRGMTFSRVGGSGIPTEQIMGIAASTAYTTDTTLWISARHTGTFRSSDAGATFSPLTVGLTTDAQADDNGHAEFNNVITAPANSGQVLFVAGYDGLFRFAAGGAQWQEIQTQAEQVVGLAVSPAYATDQTVIATTYVKGAYMSNDRGTSWKPSNVGLGAVSGNKFSPEYRLHNAVFSPNYVNDGTIFTSTPGLLAKSTDRGESWTTISVYASNVGTGLRWLIAMSPAYASDQTIFVGSVATAIGEIWRSSAGGAPGTWSRIATLGARIRSVAVSPEYPTDHTIWASTQSGIFTSTDAGANWHQTGPSGVAILAISPNYRVDRTVFAGTEAGVFVTRNAGQSWVELAAAPLSTSTHVEAISVSPNYRNDRTVLVSVLGKGLYKSVDGGTSFAATGASLLQNNLLIADYEWFTATPIQFSPAYAVDHTIFAFAQARVVKSIDDGASWQVLNLPPAADFVKPPVVAAAATTATVSEGDSGTTRVLHVPFDLSHPYKSTVTVQWQTVDVQGDAKFASSSAGDYRAASGTLTYAPGATRKFADIVVNGDALDEADELILISTSNPTNATLGGYLGLGFGLIQDDDPLPVVTPGEASAVEGNDGDTSVVSIPVTLSAPSGRTVTVDWATADHQAVAGEDYVAASGTLTFLPGETSKTIDVAVIGDTTDEPDETMLVATSHPTNATLGGYLGLGFGVIQDDDPLPAIVPGEASVAEGDADTTLLSIPVTLSGPSSRTVTVEWTTADQDAVAGEDYVAASGTLTFLPGETSKTIDVAVIGDTTVEPDETLLVVTSNPVNADLGGNGGVGLGHILNDDQEPPPP